MLTQNLVLDDAAGVETTYNLVGYTSDGSRRIGSASTLAEPLLLEIKHSTSGKGSGVVDRHLISLSRTLNDPAGVPVKAIVNITFALPRNTTVTVTDIANLFGNAVDLLTGGGFSAAGAVSTADLASILQGAS